MRIRTGKKHSLPLPARMAAPLALLLLLAACREGTPEFSLRSGEVPEIPAPLAEQLATRRIFFGHQSVGANILEGIEDLRAAGVAPGFRVAPEGHAPAGGGILLAARVGRNGDPRSKLESFARAVQEGAGKDAQIALFKFCYVDFTADTDADRLFDDYKRTMEALRAARPDLTVVHVTAPLTRRQTGWKAWVKKALGRPVSGVEDNLARNRFNALLRREYAGREPVFDLAAVESTWPDGRRETFRSGDAIGHALVPLYTPDDGHLNVTGRRQTAAALLNVLAEAPLPPAPRRAAQAP